MAIDINPRESTGGLSINSAGRSKMYVGNHSHWKTPLRYPGMDEDRQNRIPS